MTTVIITDQHTVSPKEPFQTVDTDIIGTDSSLTAWFTNTGRGSRASPGRGSGDPQLLTGQVPESAVCLSRLVYPPLRDPFPSAGEAAVRDTVKGIGVSSQSVCAPSSPTVL